MGPRADVEFGTWKSLASRLKGRLASGRLAAAGMLVLTLATSGLAAAQTDPFVGTWKLNTAKSTPARKSETRIVESSPTGMKVNVDRTNADGSNQQFNYTANLDGKAYPITGTAPYGADSIGVTLTTSNTLTFTLWRGGKRFRGRQDGDVEIERRQRERQSRRQRFDLREAIARLSLSSSGAEAG